MKEHTLLLPFYFHRAPVSERIMQQNAEQITFIKYVVSLWNSLLQAQALGLIDNICSQAGYEQGNQGSRCEV